MKTGLVTDAPHQSHGDDLHTRASHVARFDWHFWLMLLIAALVILPRSAMIANTHNECMDANFHMKLGYRFLDGNDAGLIMTATDPPLGQAIVLLPLMVTGCYPSAPLHAENWPAGRDLPGASAPGESPKSEKQQLYERSIRRAPLYGNRLSPETLLLLIGLWKAILFLPCVAVAFHWCRQLYGLPSAWLAAMLISVDPTIAGNITTVALDTLGVTSIVVACYAIWKYFDCGQTRVRFAVMALAIAAALLIKHTAVVLPVVFLAFAFRYWVWLEFRKIPMSEWRERWHRRARIIVALPVVVFILMWVLMGFDYSTPVTQCLGIVPTDAKRAFFGRDLILSIINAKQINGIYLGCFISGWAINHAGQAAMLLDHTRDGGWWYYFPVVATFKVPLGIFGILLAGLLSLFRKRLYACEFSLLFPLFLWTGFLMTSNMNYSFRHFLPAYVFILMWTSRALVGATLNARAVIWVMLGIASLEVLRFHPDYLSYINFPRHRVEYQLTDSNLDWGEGIRQIEPWLAKHPQYKSKPVRVLPRWDGAGLVVPYWTHGKVEQVWRSKPPPTDGLLIMSPVYACGVYDGGFNPYEFLRKLEPIGWVGHSMVVYDLDTPRSQTVFEGAQACRCRSDRPDRLTPTQSPTSTAGWRWRRSRSCSIRSRASPACVLHWPTRAKPSTSSPRRLTQWSVNS